MGNEYWNVLIDEYHKGLSKNLSLNEIPTKDWIRDEVNSFSHLYGIIFSATYLLTVISKEKDPVTDKRKWSEILSKCNVGSSDTTNISVLYKISVVIELKSVIDIFKNAIDRRFFPNYEQILLHFY